MAFHGVFIGVDRYQSDQIGWLTCAKQDAVALQALYADTIGGYSTLLVDEEATREGIQRIFRQLEAASSDDTVVISFSGHGSPTHELVTFNADPRRMKETAIPLDELQDWFSRIPTRRLILMLDCCFSGGLGAKVFQPTALPRDCGSTEVELQRLAGDGRLIITASAANEPAWENPCNGHGYFTHFLIEAMLGNEEVVENGRLPVYRLLEYVTRRVSDAARQFGHSQQPAMRGTLDGEMTWPIFAKGAHYRTAFPERVKAPATAEISSLVAFGFPAPMIGAWGGAIPSLNQLQLDAINEYGVLDGEHLVVVAPTTSGKTMVGELAALMAVSRRQRALFLLPLKALVADKLRHFEDVYEEFGLRTIEATGETDDISPILRGQFDIALLTYEKFSSIVLTHPHVLEQAGVVVVDEAQMIADQSRGANLEFLLTLIVMRRREGVEPQMIALSGVIGEVNGLDRWMGARLLRRNERPVPLDEGIIRGNGQREYIDAESGETILDEVPFVQPIYSGKNSSQDIVIPLVQKLVDAGQQVIVFREIVAETRGCANYLARDLNLPPAQAALDRLPGGDPSQSSGDLRQVLAKGVAFHNSHLARAELRIIEEEFRKPGSGLRVVVATTTLAMGVNTPASSVVIVGLTHPDGAPYFVAEYKNLVGRAGRLGYTERGSSYLVAMDYRTADNYWRRYVTGRPEDLQSRFLDNATDLCTLVVKTVVAGGRATGSIRAGMTAEGIATFLDTSFGAFQQTLQQGKWNWSQEDILRAVHFLVQHGLIEEREDGRLELTRLGRLAGESGTQVISIVRLVECLRPLAVDQITDPALIAAVQCTYELDQTYIPLNKKTPKEAQSWGGELRAQGVPFHVLNCMARDINEHHEEAARLKRAVATLAYVSGQEIGEIERLLARHGGGFDGSAGPIRGISARTCDLLGTAGRIAELLHPDLQLGDRIERLNVRLTLGIHADAAPLGRYAGNNLARGDYRRLTDAGLCTVDTIMAAEDPSLLECLDRSEDRLAVVRRAAGRWKADLERFASDAPVPTLAAYVA